MIQNITSSRRWTAEEDKKVLEGMARATNKVLAVQNLAAMLGRTPKAVERRYYRLCKRMHMTGQAAGVAGKMSRVFEKLMAAAEQSPTGRLTAAQLEKIAREERMKYPQVLSFWGKINSHEFWLVKEIRGLRNQVIVVQEKLRQLEEERERLENALREREEMVASIRKTLEELRAVFAF
ncbi:Myb-like DNA-binding domain-containing protein [Thermanaeromonas toyohensis ToBE]|uniref:Myb-like DNA-binding domain-containing protein n=1 Tax=Thermanaeromonas toyohensis ToBE TaxID=698762 RepID=A0A1W1VTP8_9FIRM|nr:hypothetical protein [Thermanaeromonas toyohensis]SMB96739.1 Myb-like DNA-binding domain-containing protein [Thermanaeromonas toyohensis ToBE]